MLPQNQIWYVCVVLILKRWLIYCWGHLDTGFRNPILSWIILQSVFPWEVLWTKVTNKPPILETHIAILTTWLNTTSTTRPTKSYTVYPNQCPWRYFIRKMTYYHLNFLFPGAGSEHRREGGGFLRADAAIRLQWDSDVFPPGSLLHLPKPTDSASTPSQDRCRLNRWWTKRQETQTRNRRMEDFNPALGRRYSQTWLTQLHPLYHTGTCHLRHTSVQGFLWDPNVITILSWTMRAMLFCKLLGNWKKKKSSCLNNTAYLLYFPKDRDSTHDVRWRCDEQVEKKKNNSGGIWIP